MFTTGFSMSSQQFAEPMTGETIPWMKSKALEGNYAICGSVMMEENGKYYNRFILAESDTGLCSYDKKHLFRMSTENENYQAGDQKVCFTINGFRICPQICYDLRFPVWSRNTDNYDVLIYVANWPEARRHHWISLLKARAIENQCYVVGVNRVGADKNVSYAGDSMVFDFNGNTLLDLGDEARIGEITLNLADLVEYRHMFPAWKDADAFELI
jgi:predicted amidohydrolase